MLRRSVGYLLVLIVGLIALGIARPAAGQYRGVPAGWPYNTGGYYAAYPVSGNGQAYYVARPVAATQRPAAIAYVPVNAAYANPNYFGAYATTRAAYNPQATAAYYPQAYPQSSATVNYAPNTGYAISPAGSSYAGSEAATYLGQPAAVNYVPPQVTYRPAYAATPVYAYQPVTAYQVGAQPTACYQPAPAPTCQTQGCRRGFLSFLNPFNWFRRRSCGTAPATTAYSCAPTNCYSVNQCGATAPQPYYPANVIPTVPAPSFPTGPAIRSVPSPILGPTTVPPPPTRSGTTTIIPAETRPSLAPGAGGSFSTGPAVTTPGGSFTPAPPSGFGVPPAGGGFGSGTNYAPAVDPYSGASTSGRAYRGTSTTTVREPGSRAATERPLAPSVQPVPDPDAIQRREPQIRAPQLLDPRDKTAAFGKNRWAVVPAVWPVKTVDGRVMQINADRSPYLRPVQSEEPARHQYEPVRHFVPTAVELPTPVEATYDDGGWRSAR